MKDQKRTEYIAIKVSVDERDILQVAADDEGLPISTYIRFVALKAAKEKSK